MNRQINLSQMKIAIVDDHDLVREGLNVVLRNNGVHNIEKFSTARDLVAQLDAGKEYDFYIIYLQLPDIDGFTLIKIIRAKLPKSRIIVSTIHDEIWTLRRLLSIGVNAIVYKSGDGSEIIQAIDEINRGNNYYCAEVEHSIAIADDSASHPTSRELEVLKQIAMGRTTLEIAASLYVSDNTVEAHRKSLFQKLGAVNVADLIVKAFDLGYLQKNCVKR